MIDPLMGQSHLQAKSTVETLNIFILDWKISSKLDISNIPKGNFYK